MPLADNPLPHNRDAEKTILGAILTNNAHWLAAQEHHLKPDHFFMQENRLIFEAIAALAETDTPIDTITLMDYLAQHNRLEAAGGAAYIATLQDGMPSVINSKQYARIVHEKWELRDFMQTAHRLERVAQDGLVSPADLRAQLEEYRDRVAQCDRQAAHFLMRIAQLEFMLGIKKKSDE